MRGLRAPAGKKSGEKAGSCERLRRSTWNLQAVHLRYKYDTIAMFKTWDRNVGILLEGLMRNYCGVLLEPNRPHKHKDTFWFQGPI